MPAVAVSTRRREIGRVTWCSLFWSVVGEPRKCPAGRQADALAPGCRAPDAAQRVALREAVRCRAGAQLACLTGVPALRSGMKNAAARPGHVQLLPEADELEQR